MYSKLCFKRSKIISQHRSIRLGNVGEFLVNNSFKYNFFNNNNYAEILTVDFIAFTTYPLSDSRLFLILLVFILESLFFTQFFFLTASGR